MSGVRVELECGGSWSEWRVPPTQSDSRTNEEILPINELYPRGRDGRPTKHIIDIDPDGSQATVFQTVVPVAALKSPQDVYTFDCIVGQGEIGRLHITLESAPPRRPRFDNT